MNRRFEIRRGIARGKFTFEVEDGVSVFAVSRETFLDIAAGRRTIFGTSRQL